MQDLELIADKTSDEEETWAQKLMHECEQELLIPILDTPYIYVKETETKVTPTYKEIKQLKNVAHTTAIERQIQQRTEQTTARSPNTKKVTQGFWSLFKKRSSTN